MSLGGPRRDDSDATGSRTGVRAAWLVGARRFWCLGGGGWRPGRPGGLGELDFAHHGVEMM